MDYQTIVTITIGVSTGAMLRYIYSNVWKPLRFVSNATGIPLTNLDRANSKKLERAFDIWANPLATPVERGGLQEISRSLPESVKSKWDEFTDKYRRTAAPPHYSQGLMRLVDDFVDRREMLKSRSRFYQNSDVIQFVSS